MTEEELAAIEELAGASPAGPWQTGDELNADGYVWIGQAGGDWGDIADAYSVPAAAFIVAAREAVPALLAEVRRLRGVGAELLSSWADAEESLYEECATSRENDAAWYDRHAATTARWRQRLGLDPPAR